MSEIKWDVEPGPIEQEHQEPPECPVGFKGHTWTLSMVEGQVSVLSGCEVCDDIWNQIGGEDFYMAGTITGSLVFEPDHPDLGGWHFDQRCDCGWQWRFEPSAIEPEAQS